jgi:raffinose/stachyose/melibiose transport system permease protein
MSKTKELHPFVQTLRKIGKCWYCYLMMLNTVALLVTFAYYPALSAFYHAFTIWDGYNPARWVGLNNFREVFTMPIYRKAAQNMALLGSWQVVRAAVFPLIAAALIYRMRSERSAYFFRLLFVLPIVVPGVVQVMVWQQLYDPSIGLFNEILKSLDMKPIAWLNAPQTALPSLMFVDFPWVNGVAMLIYLAGLLAIPSQIIDAAAVDGASSWRRFFSIELPLILPQVRLIVILNAIGAFQNFGWQLLVTRGGPIDATTVPAWQMYNEAILAGRFGIGSAIGVLLFVLIFTLTIINRVSLRSSVEYQAG